MILALGWRHLTESHLASAETQSVLTRRQSASGGGSRTIRTLSLQHYTPHSHISLVAFKFTVLILSILFFSLLNLESVETVQNIMISFWFKKCVSIFKL